MTMHSAKGLEFPVVYMAALEMGIVPHDRSIGKPDEIEEERRLAFVGMTRAKEELYLCHARLREFRGNTHYAVPSMFLEELPIDAVHSLDLSLNAIRSQDATAIWRTGGPAAQQGWSDTGLRTLPAPITPKAPSGDGGRYHTGMMVHHATYGPGRITEVSGHGVMRKLKIRFKTAGERSFIADKVTLEIVRA
jgi:DNA helicase-2/ATP-dependent DNA helicase PcrA